MALQAQMFHDRWHRTGWTRVGLGVLFLVLVALAVGLGVWALVRGTRHTHPVAASGYPLTPPTDPALEMLRMRFAVRRDRRAGVRRAGRAPVRRRPAARRAAGAAERLNVPTSARVCTEITAQR